MSLEWGSTTELGELWARTFSAPTLLPATQLTRQPNTLVGPSTLAMVATPWGTTDSEPVHSHESFPYMLHTAYASHLHVHSKCLEVYCTYIPSLLPLGVLEFMPIGFPQSLQPRRSFVLSDSPADSDTDPGLKTPLRLRGSPLGHSRGCGATDFRITDTAAVETPGDKDLPKTALELVEANEITEAKDSGDISTGTSGFSVDMANGTLIANWQDRNPTSATEVLELLCEAYTNTVNPSILDAFNPTHTTQQQAFDASGNNTIPSDQLAQALHDRSYMACGDAYYLNAEQSPIRVRNTPSTLQVSRLVRMDILHYSTGLIQIFLANDNVGTGLTLSNF
eukprot:scaffold4599_cov219-Amphora_coffeaeformis.AAC.10